MAQTPCSQKHDASHHFVVAFLFFVRSRMPHYSSSCQFSVTRQNSKTSNTYYLCLALCWEKHAKSERPLADALEGRMGDLHVGLHIFHGDATIYSFHDTEMTCPLCLCLIFLSGWYNKASQTDEQHKNAFVMHNQELTNRPCLHKTFKLLSKGTIFQTDGWGF